MNAPPPDDMQNASEGSMRPGQDHSVKPEHAKRMRDAIEARFPGESGKKETDIGKAIKKMLGIS